MFQWEVKAPMPSTCFRSICKQISKLHEAIIDILPEDQIKVGQVVPFEGQWLFQFDRQPRFLSICCHLQMCWPRWLS